MKDNIADDPNHDPVTAKRRCEALAKNDLSKEGYKKSASVNSKEPPSWAVNMGLVEVDYEENEDNLKSASVENEGTLIGTMYYGKNRESNTVVRLV